MPVYRVLHVDLDQFIAAVEILRRPELAGLPVVVGGKGDPTQRGVVATASYAAREHGVRSGMPLRTARKRIPDAVFLPADNPAYEVASEGVMDVLRGFGPGQVLEVMGWDEAFLGGRTDDPDGLAADVRRAVLEGTGLHCSIGIGDNLLRAKIATELGKPPGPGVFTLTAENWDDVMAGRPTRALWGIGAKTSQKLADRGIRTVGELAAADPATLAADLGPTLGPYYVQLGRGIGRERVEGTPWVPRSRSRETTFPADLTDWHDVRAEVVALAHRVADDVAAEGRDVARMAVKIRFAPFTTRTRSITLDAPTQHAEAIEAGALEVLGLFRQGRAVRLVGVRAEFERS
ncbi:DNA polymerase IV [Pseudonocardia sp.]|uniref:DNA polymerase IV n=1 Tax=Pseudonocardia sp. TaxID=60912 RepID=UPI0026145D77|nr:DNA polymerase IV [Pseudonocardia sp.]MCW2716551.1 polymerase [Pseudonocardia sp.]MDT7616139.1 polymerase [Pseudonocardiales bacterium]